MFRRSHIALRAVERDDLFCFVEWLNNEEVRRNLLLRMPMSLAQEEKWFESLLKDTSRHVFVIDAHDTEGAPIPVGVCSLEQVNRIDGQALFGIFIGDPNQWGKGYGRAATQAILEIAFNELRLNRVHLEVFTDNERAIKCYQNLGFVHEGTARERAFRGGRFIDVHLMSMLAKEYFAESHPARFS